MWRGSTAATATYAVHEQAYANVRRASDATGRAVGVLVDLQGPKIRLARFADGPHQLEPGDIFTITTEDVPGTKELVGTTFPQLAQDVTAGDTLLVDDGKIRLKVIETDGVRVRTEVVVGGMVSNNKGINLPGVDISAPAMSEKDEADLRWALRIGADLIALSFVRSPRDVQRARIIMAEEGIRVPIIAKIEKPEAVEHLQEIIDAFDGVMIARGDLGVELPLEAVPIVQKHAIELARRWAKPVIVATQMLESMIENPVPTRAETSDVANAVLDGADAVMLSGETSVGAHPIAVVETMARIIESTEEHGLEPHPAPRHEAAHPDGCDDAGRGEHRGVRRRQVRVRGQSIRRLGAADVAAAASDPDPVVHRPGDHPLAQRVPLGRRDVPGPTRAHDRRAHGPPRRHAGAVRARRAR